MVLVPFISGWNWVGTKWFPKIVSLQLTRTKTETETIAAAVETRCGSVPVPGRWISLHVIVDCFGAYYD